jgi:hypothetical protein
MRQVRWQSVNLPRKKFLFDKVCQVMIRWSGPFQAKFPKKP